MASPKPHAACHMPPPNNGLQQIGMGLQVPLRGTANPRQQLNPNVGQGIGSLPAPRKPRATACRRVAATEAAATLRRQTHRGYTPGMKTAVSVPDDVFDRAELLAKHLKLNRSQLFSRALAEFLARHAPEEVTDALNRVCDELDGEPDPFALAASAQTLARTAW